MLKARISGLAYSVAQLQNCGLIDESGLGRPDDEIRISVFHLLMETGKVTNGIWYVSFERTTDDGVTRTEVHQWNMNVDNYQEELSQLRRLADNGFVWIDDKVPQTEDGVVFL